MGMSRSLRSFNHEQQEAEAKSRLNLWANLVLAVCGWWHCCPVWCLLLSNTYAQEPKDDLQAVWRQPIQIALKLGPVSWAFFREGQGDDKG
jgi:hypothetical protein